MTSSVMQFPCKGRVVNLLDTPGHEDFSEDTYRTLTAVDSVLMMIDGAKGVEDKYLLRMRNPGEVNARLTELEDDSYDDNFSKGKYVHTDLTRDMIQINDGSSPIPVKVKRITDLLRHHGHTLKVVDEEKILERWAK